MALKIIKKVQYAGCHFHKKPWVKMLLLGFLYSLIFVFFINVDQKSLCVKQSRLRIRRILSELQVLQSKQPLSSLNLYQGVRRFSKKNLVKKIKRKAEEAGISNVRVRFVKPSWALNNLHSQEQVVIDLRAQSERSVAFFLKRCQSIWGIESIPYALTLFQDRRASGVVSTSELRGIYILKGFFLSDRALFKESKKNVG